MIRLQPMLLIGRDQHAELSFNHQVSLDFRGKAVAGLVLARFQCLGHLPAELVKRIE
ncbi:MAG: hypothetical protein V7754_19580 [Halioglobus sp.]